MTSTTVHVYFSTTLASPRRFPIPLDLLNGPTVDDSSGCLVESEEQNNVDTDQTAL